MKIWIQVKQALSHNRTGITEVQVTTPRDHFSPAKPKVKASYTEVSTTTRGPKWFRKLIGKA